jgi:hypothetical protein
VWTDEDRDLLLALLAEDAVACTGCGHPLDVTTDGANRGRWDVKRRTCEACLVLEAAVGNDHEGAKTARGVKYLVVRDE